MGAGKAPKSDGTTLLASLRAQQQQLRLMWTWDVTMTALGQQLLGAQEGPWDESASRHSAEHCTALLPAPRPGAVPSTCSLTVFEVCLSCSIAFSLLLFYCTGVRKHKEKQLPLSVCTARTRKHCKLTRIRKQDDGNFHSL